MGEGVEEEEEEEFVKVCVSSILGGEGVCLFFRRGVRGNWFKR